VIAQNVTATAQTNETMPASISTATAEVTRLAQSGVSDEVVIAFVRRSQGRFELSEETIISEGFGAGPGGDHRREIFFVSQDRNRIVTAVTLTPRGAVIEMKGR
jgi:hypothetical protein